MTTLPSADLDHILYHTREIWQPLRNQRIFITGGTGFFGKWLLESFIHVNDKLTLNAQAVVLTRDSATAQARLGPIASHPAITFHTGDVRTFAFPPGPFSHIIHAATPSSATVAAEDPAALLDTIVEGTRHILNFAAHVGVKRILLTSSGAVYGTQPPAMPHIAEDYPGTPDPIDPRFAYGRGKHIAEELCIQYHTTHGIQSTIARCFAFVGPHLPLNAHFAIGNFIRDALAGGPITITGDGTPFRSYLYTADLAIWLWTILFRGRPCRPYNVGSEDAISIADLAHTVATIYGHMTGRTPSVNITGKLQPGMPAPRYVPSTRRASDELGLKPQIDLRTAITKTIQWHLDNLKKARMDTDEHG